MPRHPGSRNPSAGEQLVVVVADFLGQGGCGVAAIIV